MKNLLLVLSTIRWQDVVDIVLNSFILFRLYLLFRDTYVFRILLGLASRAGSYRALLQWPP